MHNPALNGVWIKPGRMLPLKSNTGRQRSNISGTINIETMAVQIRFDETINAVATGARMDQIEASKPRSLEAAYPAVKK